MRDVILGWSTLTSAYYDCGDMYRDYRYSRSHSNSDWTIIQAEYWDWLHEFSIYSFKPCYNIQTTWYEVRIPKLIRNINLTYVLARCRSPTQYN